jgi:fluoride exporter
MREILLVGSAGFLGTLARYLTYKAFYLMELKDFPFATLTINVAGSFLIGIIWTLVEKPFAYSPELLLYGATGFLGAFTTYSTFSGETFVLLRTGQWFFAFLSVAGNLILGVLAVFLGRLVVGHFSS